MAISVTNPIDSAMKRTKKVLFTPFEIGIWFKLGFCVFLANLGQGGGFSYQFMQIFGNVGAGGAGSNEQWIKDNPGLFIAIMVGVLLVIIALFLTLSWLSSRGKFMFLDGVVQGRGAVVEPWREYKKEGNSLFKFRVCLGLLWIVMLGVIGVLCVLIALPDINTETFGGYAIAAIVVGSILGISGFLTLAYTGAMLNDFVTPIMYTRRMTSKAAFGLFWREILVSNKGTIALFYLMLIVIGMAMGMISMMVMCATCCLAALPYISSVVLLPVFVFVRCYALYMLEQFGGQWKVFPENVCTSCGYDLRGSIGQPACPECGQPIEYDEPPLPPDDWGPESLPG